MKHIYLVILTLLIHLSALGQNNLFIPFGQTVSEVRSFLDSRDYVDEVIEDSKEGILRAILEANKHVEYVFADGQLCATSVTRNYSDKRSAREVEKKCLEYMQITGPGEVKETHNENITCHTVVTDSRVIKLFVIEHHKSKTLTFTSFSKQYGPLMAKKDYYYENELFK